MILVKLFLVFLKASLLSFGGAHSFLPILERELVDSNSWLSKEEFLDVLGIVKIFPGAISIKFATYTGQKIAGIWGVVIANLGNLLPTVLLIFFATTVYSKYKQYPSIRSAFSMIQLVIFAMIIAVSFKLLDINQLVQVKGLVIVVVSFVLFIYTKINPAFIIIGAGIIGVFLGR